MTDRRRTGLDRRTAEVQRTIDAIRQMGLTCDRTPRTAQYVITARCTGGIEVHYATSSGSALALAMRLRDRQTP